MSKIWFFLLGAWWTLAISLTTESWSELLCSVIAISIVFTLLELIIILCREKDE